jgi:hypothetical protein
MRVEEILQVGYSPRVSVHLDAVKDDDKNEVAGMLRGLMCAIDGWGSIAGLTNEKCTGEKPLILPFTSVDNAHYFKSCVEYYFSEAVLEKLRVAKRKYRSN